MVDALRPLRSMCPPSGGPTGQEDSSDDGRSRCEARGVTPAAVSAFRSIVGAQHVLVDDDLRAGYESDWTGRWRGRADAVVRPATTAEVVDVLRRCNEEGIAVITQAGNTGLVGGSVPRQTGSTPAIVLSTRRLSSLGPCDEASMQVTAGSGATIAAWRAHARAAGLDTPIDFAARGTATVGGAIATNAGGSRVLRYGTMRSQVCGIEAVLADGTVVGSLAGLPKETAGLHWPSLLAGSEGTLGVITEARLRLVPRYDEVVTALIAVESLQAAGALLARLRSRVPSLDAAEVMTDEAMTLVCDHLDVAVPGASKGPARPPAWVLIECADHRDPTDELAAAMVDAAGIGEVIVADGGARRERLIEMRDRMTEAIAGVATAMGSPVFKLDVAVPLDRLDDLAAVASRAAEADGARLIAFGHLAEGNLHLNHLGVTDPARLADVVLGAVADMGGTISAEHGIGVAKTPWLPLIRRPGDLAAQAAIRSALDPNGILNPGVLDPHPSPHPSPQPTPNA